MKRMIPFLNIAGAYGGDQEWLPRPLMRLGGCSTICACHAAACLAHYDQTRQAIYPYDGLLISRDQFVDFAVDMFQYVHPGWRGMPKLSLFCHSFNQWSAHCGVSVDYTTLAGEAMVKDAAAFVRTFIDAGLPLQFLQLKHQDKELAEDLEWHWFTVTGYDDGENFQLIFANEGQLCQVQLARLWNSGYEEKGGLLVVK